MLRNESSRMRTTLGTVHLTPRIIRYDWRGGGRSPALIHGKSTRVSVGGYSKRQKIFLGLAAPLSKQFVKLHLIGQKERFLAFGRSAPVGTAFARLASHQAINCFAVEQVPREAFLQSGSCSLRYRFGRGRLCAETHPKGRSNPNPGTGTVRCKPVQCDDGHGLITMQNYG